MDQYPVMGIWLLVGGLYLLLDSVFLVPRRGTFANGWEPRNAHDLRVGRLASAAGATVAVMFGALLIISWLHAQP